VKIKNFIPAGFVNILIWPQLYTIIKNKSAWDVSLCGYVAALVFSILGLIYGIVKKDASIVIFNGLSSIGTLLIVIALSIYR
jgi:uncharacterized protein with PQ loop repeat